MAHDRVLHQDSSGAGNPTDNHRERTITDYREESEESPRPTVTDGDGKAPERRSHPERSGSPPARQRVAGEDTVKGVFDVKKAYVRIAAIASALAALLLAGGANVRWR